MHIYLSKLNACLVLLLSLGQFSLASNFPYAMHVFSYPFITQSWVRMSLRIWEEIIGFITLNNKVKPSSMITPQKEGSQKTDFPCQDPWDTVFGY